MNLVEIILKEHSKAMRDSVAHYVGSSPARFAELIDVFLKGPYWLTQRAAWPLNYCVTAHPELIKPHLSRVLKSLEVPAAPTAVKRNVVRLLQFIDIPKSFQGRAAASCFGYLADKKETIAVRVFSMTVLGNIATKQPELKEELKVIIEDQLPYGSAAFRSRGQAVLKQLAR
ncbi:MAG: hypothetical protein K2U26_18555 [Cyclobacteriaceae bacterium]|nr:hypothetical protein [Cyclobacteriaceae bacterium]